MDTVAIDAIGDTLLYKLSAVPVMLQYSCPLMRSPITLAIQYNDYLMTFSPSPQPILQLG